MEGRAEQLRKKLERLLQETAETSAELQKLDGTQPEVPHYSAIEKAAHETGKKLSRMIQQSRIEEVALAATPQAACPTCGSVCAVTHPRRKLKSIDGRVEALEPKAHCPHCRRDFFPSTGPTRAGRP
jgi:DNA repair exonuclease SbcCD ATPase subunit